MVIEQIVLLLSRHRKSGWTVEWERYALYEGPVAFGDVTVVQRCAVHLVMAGMFAHEWRNPPYVRAFYATVLEGNYKEALSIERPQEETFSLVHLRSASVLVSVYKETIPSDEQVKAVALNGLNEVMSWMSSKG